MRTQVWPLTGRDSSLAELRSLRDDKSIRSVIVAGHPGIGKSRLAHTFADELEARGAMVVRVLATRAAASLPLGAFTITSPIARNLGATAPEAAIAQAADALEETANGRELIVFVDDAHHLDDLSAALILHLATTGKAFVIGTMRVDESCPDAVTALHKEWFGQYFDLAPLDASGIEELLTRYLDGLIEPPTARVLIQRSDGNVLYLIELVTGLLADGTLDNSQGAWRLTREIAPPTRLITLIADRLVGLSGLENDALALISLGEPLRNDALPREISISTLEALEQRRLITIDTENRLALRLAHPLYGDVIRQSIGALRRRRLLTQLVEGAERIGSDDPDDLLRIALWRLESDDIGEPGIFIKASGIAKDRWDFPLAFRLASTALERGGGHEAAVAVAELDFLLRRHDECEERLPGLIAETAEEAERFRLVALRMDNLMWGSGAIPQALEVAKAAEADFTNLHIADQLAGKRANAHFILGEMAPVIELLDPILSERDIAEQRVLSRTILALALAVCGDFDRAWFFLNNAPADLVTNPDPGAWPAWYMQFTECFVLYMEGRPNDLIELAQRMHADALATNDHWAEAVFSMWTGLGLGLRGDIAQAATWSARAVHMLRSSPPPSPMFITIAGADYVFHRALLGEIDQAITEDQMRGPISEVGGMRTWWNRAHAWLSVAQGDLLAARKILVESGESFAEYDSPTRRMGSLHDLARIGYAKEAVALIEGLDTTVGSGWGDVVTGYIRANAEGDGEALLACSEAFERRGTILYAAEAAADAAVAFGRVADGTKATAAHRRAQSLSATIGDPRTPALAPISTRMSLTKAERNIANLAASGMSDREIAESLTISVRTVSNTLGRVYAKLGLAGRQDLSGAL